MYSGKQGVLEVSILMVYFDRYKQQEEHDIGDRDLGSKAGSAT